MNDLRMVITAVTHQLYGLALDATGREHDPDRDRGAVSLEQVLWFVAVAVSVGVIATILWNRIFDAADDAELDLPEPPGG